MDKRGACTKVKSILGHETARCLPVSYLISVVAIVLHGCVQELRSTLRPFHFCFSHLRSLAENEEIWFGFWSRFHFVKFGLNWLSLVCF